MPATDDEPDTTPPEESRSSGRKVLLLSVAAVVVVAVAGLVVYLLTRDDPAETAAGPGVPTIEGSPAPSGTVPGSTPQGTPGQPASLAPPAPADADEAQSVAEQAATALSSADAETLVQLSCDPDSADSDDTLPENATVEVVGEPVFDGDTASVTIRVTVPGVEPAEVPMPLIKQNGRWCIPA